MTDLPLLAVPNVSEGREPAVVEAIGRAFTGAGAARLLDVHADHDHHRAVFTLAGSPGSLALALARGAARGLELIDICNDDQSQIGQHPYVGAVDVVPVVYLGAGMRGAACAEALVAAHLIGEGLGIPVFLDGELAWADRGSTGTRAELRRGGREGLRRRIDSGELRPDFGPRRMHPTAGAALVGAREPLVAFNLELAPPAGVREARAIAALIREGGTEGLPGVRAIGIELHRGDPASGGERAVGQVSMNVERPGELALKEVVRAVRRHGQVVCGELVGLAPRAALEGFPRDLPLPGFDPARHVIENALGL
jgi:glutamate formiminotransferase / 5-formyltetrahydrofolate cyclo-ligase